MTKKDCDMKTRLVLDKVTIETTGIGTFPISDYVEGRLEKAFEQYNKACESLKSSHKTHVPALGSIESDWFRFANWAGTYKVVTEFLVSYGEKRATFPNMAGYIERVEG